MRFNKYDIVKVEGIEDLGVIAYYVGKNRTGTEDIYCVKFHNGQSDIYESRLEHLYPQMHIKLGV